MEGFGAGAAATAAALTDLRGGTPGQIAKAIVLAMSPTIAVPCTPRVMVAGLCTTHISGAILIGNQASHLVLKTSLPVDVDVDVMIAMAARVHVEAAPIITNLNLKYLEPYFRRIPSSNPGSTKKSAKQKKNRLNRLSNKHAKKYENCFPPPGRWQRFSEK